MRIWRNLRSPPSFFWSTKAPCCLHQAKATFWPSALMIKDKMPGSHHGARGSLHSAPTRKPRGPVRAGITNWDFGFLSRHLHVPCQAGGPQEDVYRNPGGGDLALRCQPSLPLHGHLLLAGPVTTAPSRSQGTWPQRGQVGSPCPIHPKPAHLHGMAHFKGSEELHMSADRWLAFMACNG